MVASPMNMKPGIYNIYKPSGPTSHDMVDKIRKLSRNPTSHKATQGREKVGHAGTLDPFAEGVLIVAIGRAYTRKLGQFLKMDKTYRTTIRLGATSDTDDLTGKIMLIPNAKKVTRRQVTMAIKKFIGKIKQTPPAFSAIKIKGKKAYELARRGITPELKPRPVKIYAIKILKYRWPFLEITTKVSSGTYIRSLARDLGQALGIGGYLEKLTRTKVGRFNLTKSINLDNI